MILMALPVTEASSEEKKKKFDAPKDMVITFVERNDPSSSRGNYLQIDIALSEDVYDYMTDDEKYCEDPAFYYISDESGEAERCEAIVLSSRKVKCEFQYDYKLDDGDWQYGSSLDLDTNKNNCRVVLGRDDSVVQLRFYGNDLSEIFSENKLPERGFFDSHKIYFRVRQLVTYNTVTKLYSNDDLYKNKNYSNISFYRFLFDKQTFSGLIVSDWGEASYENKIPTIDPLVLINHPPVIKTAELKKADDGNPYFDCTAEPVHDEVNLLTSVSKSQLKVDMWVKRGGGEWVSKRGIKGFSEKFTMDARDFFGSEEEIDKVAYEVKFRYEFDEADYTHNGKTGIIYSPFSNVISKTAKSKPPEPPKLRQPLWSNASQWALDELEKACEMELIPEVLNGSDFTKPITRAEFAAICVKAYEKLGNTTLEAADVNPFNDTQDSEVLKAYRAGFVAGISDDVFEPESLLNREQAAAMLTRVVKKVSFPKWTLATDVNYALEYTMSEKFSDDENISDWARPSVYFMVSKGIISGFGNNTFGAKNINNAQKQNGYANATREQAVLMAYRVVASIGISK